MRKFAGAILFFLLLGPWARATVINVEFKFTPFVGDPEKDEKVTTVAGRAAIFINNVPASEQEVHADDLPVLFEEHEVAPAIWVPMSSVGPASGLAGWRSMRPTVQPRVWNYGNWPEDRRIRRCACR